jgi:hypothetical protein
MKQELNKWQVTFYFGRDYRTMERGWKQVRFGIFNLHTMPEAGVMIHKELYRGFIWQFYIWLPIDS